MRFSLLFLVGLLLSLFGGTAAGQANDDPSEAQRAETLRRYGLDPASSLDSRVGETSASVLKMFEEAKLPAPTPHVLTEEERRRLSAAFAALPPLHRRILSEHLRSVSFLDGMPNTALTSTVNPDEPYRLCDITIRAAVLHQNASEWLTEKERTCFSADGSPLSVSIEAGKRDALVYVLLHEATHVVDFCLKITANVPSGKPLADGVTLDPFSDGVWSERTIPVPQYRDPLRERAHFYINGAALPIDQAEAVYQSLRKTPFVSLYGGSNCADDLAEYVAVYYWTRMLKQPFRIVIRKEGKPVFVYEPMKSDLVRSRIDQMQRFYKPLPSARRKPDLTPLSDSSRFFSLLPTCGRSQASLTQPPPSGEKVITLGKPAHSVVSGDVVVRSPATVTGLAFSHDGSTLLVAREQPDPTAGAEAGPIEIWSLSPIRRKETSGGTRRWVAQAALSPDGKTFACRAGHGLQLWDWQKGRKTYEIGLDELHSDKNTLEDSEGCDGQTEDTFAFLPDSSILYTGMKHKRLMRLDTATGEIQPTDLKFPPQSEVAISQDGTQICVEMYGERGFLNGFVFYDVRTSALVRTLPFAIDNTFGMVFFPDGKRLLTLEGERAHVIEIATGKVLYSLPSLPGKTPAIFSPDGKLLATPGNHVVYVWKAETGEKIAELPHQNQVTALAFAPDGHRLAVGFFDSTIKLWTLP